MAENKKKVVRVESDKSSTKAGGAKATFTPSPEAKAKAGKFRLFAALLWLLAIGGEVAAIFWLLPQEPVNMVLLIVALVVIGALALGGSMLWKRANQADPASRSDKFRFFVQNQLGAIITIIAFLPLIIMIFLNKDMDGKQKGIAGGIGIALLLVVGLLSADFNPPSTEQYDEETQFIVELTGEDLVFWTASGGVYHLCEDAQYVQLESIDNTIYSGTVGDAHAANKRRPADVTIDREIRECGFEPVDLDAVDWGDSDAGEDEVSDNEDADNQDADAEESETADA